MKHWFKKTLGIVVGLGFIMAISPLIYAEKARGMKKFEPRSYPVSNVKSYNYYSEIMDRNYDISVSFPKDYEENADKQFPALLLTDGNYTFPIAHNLAAGLVANINSPLIISVGAPFEEGDGAFSRRRTYEFSPPDWPMTDPFGRMIAKDYCERWQVTLQECTGGAPKFLEFIISELLPDLYKVYRIDPENIGLFGTSAGGFFAAWAIFQENSPFKKYIISSPAMAYGDGEIFRQEKLFADNHKNLPVEVYMSSGALEIDDGYLEGVGKIVSGQARLSGVLRRRNYPGLTLYSEIHQGLGHTDVTPASIARGLRLLYPGQ